MKVKVFVRGELHEKAGTGFIKIPIEDRESVDTLLIKLSRRSPSLVQTILDPRTGDLNESCDILLNGRSIQGIRGIHTRLKDKDELTISYNED